MLYYLFYKSLFLFFKIELHERACALVCQMNNGCVMRKSSGLLTYTTTRSLSFPLQSAGYSDLLGDTQKRCVCSCLYINNNRGKSVRSWCNGSSDQFFMVNPGVRCSSVVRAFAHGAMGHQIDPSW